MFVWKFCLFVFILKGKCGGIGYTGPTGCPSGSSCVYVNDWYSQCQPSNSNNNPTATAPTTLTTQSTNPSTSASTLSGGTANLWVNKIESYRVSSQLAFYFRKSVVVLASRLQRVRPDRVVFMSTTGTLNVSP